VVIEQHGRIRGNWGCEIATQKPAIVANPVPVPTTSGPWAITKRWLSPRTSKARSSGSNSSTPEVGRRAARLLQDDARVGYETRGRVMSQYYEEAPSAYERG
jgi:hypothetical protein